MHLQLTPNRSALSTYNSTDKAALCTYNSLPLAQRYVPTTLS